MKFCKVYSCKPTGRLLLSSTRTLAVLHLPQVTVATNFTLIMILPVVIHISRLLIYAIYNALFKDFTSFLIKIRDGMILEMLIFFWIDMKLIATQEQL